MKSTANRWIAGARQCGQFRFIALAFPLLMLAGGGCRVAQQTVALPGQMVTAVVPGLKSTAPDPGVLQAEVLRYADEFTSDTFAALNDYDRKINTPEVHIRAVEWKLALGSSAVDIATGPNPIANMLDFVALTTMMRLSLEERAAQAIPPGSLDAWLGASRNLETNVWKIAATVLTADQQKQLTTAIDRWREQNKMVSASFLARPQAMALIIREHGEADKQSGSVFSLASFDPMSGLDPAIREVTRTRLFAERAMFTFQRMPLFLRWQVEIMTYQTLQQEQLTNTVQSLDRLSLAAESASRTAALLPERITEERKAILNALQSQEGQLRGLSTNVSLMLDSGDKMSASLNTTLITFTALMKLFGVGEPSTNAVDTNSPPFNILDYAHTADRVAAMAAQVDALLKDANSTVDSPAINVLSARAQNDAKSVMDHAFILAAGLIVLFFAGAIVYRRLGRSPPKGV